MNPVKLDYPCETIVESDTSKGWLEILDRWKLMCKLHEDNQRQRGAKPWVKNGDSKKE